MAGVTVTSMDIDGLEPGLWYVRKLAQATAPIEFTVGGTAEPRQITVRIGCAQTPWRRPPVHRFELPTS